MNWPVPWLVANALALGVNLCFPCALSRFNWVLYLGVISNTVIVSVDIAYYIHLARLQGRAVPSSWFLAATILLVLGCACMDILNLFLVIYVGAWRKIPPYT